MAIKGVPSDQIHVEMDSRRYGILETTDEKFRQAIPGGLQELAADLRRGSALLALPSAPSLEKRTILDAYAKDLALLEARIREFEDCVRQAIRSSIITGQKSASRRVVEDKTEQTWSAIRKELPPLAKVPLMELPFTRAAKAPAELLEELKLEFERATQLILQHFTFWLHRLVEREFVGLVEWADLDVCRYHYFRHAYTETEIERKERLERTIDPSQEWGERTQEKLVEERRVRREQFRERHIHHIMSAKLYRLDEYRMLLPPRVQQFLDAVPQWLRPNLQIVDGQITMEEILRRKVSDETVVESEVLSVYKYSPGILFGPFNLIGWSADDLAAESSVAGSLLDAVSGELGWILVLGILAIEAVVAARTGFVGWVAVGISAGAAAVALFALRKLKRK